MDCALMSGSQLSTEELINCVNSKIIECDSLLNSSKVLLNDKQGANRLYSKILSERKFYVKLLKTPEKIKEEHIRSTNLRHLSAVLDCVSKSNGVIEILKPITFNDDPSHSVKQVVIDIVADQGKTWIKVVARNPQSLYLISLGAAGYGKRSLVHQMKDLVKCASINPFMYKPPEVKVWFTAGVAIQLKKALNKIRVESIGNCIEMEEPYVEDSLSSDNSDHSDHDDDDDFCQHFNEENETNQTSQESNMNINISQTLPSKQNPDISSSNASLWKNKNLLTPSQIPQNAILNLDVSTMIAYVSSVTNGSCHFVFKDSILTEQAKSERQCPVKPILDHIFEGHQLVCCEMAHLDFQEIVSTIGGPLEKERAKSLLERVKIVPDQPSERAACLNISSKVKIRSRVIFGTGDSLKAVTITANQGFLRACQGQGVHFVSFLHESRALTELKEATAVKI